MGVTGIHWTDPEHSLGYTGKASGTHRNTLSKTWQPTGIYWHTLGSFWDYNTDLTDVEICARVSPPSFCQSQGDWNPLPAPPAPVPIPRWSQHAPPAPCCSQPCPPRTKQGVIKTNIFVSLFLGSDRVGSSVGGRLQAQPGIATWHRDLWDGTAEDGHDTAWLWNQCPLGAPAQLQHCPWCSQGRSPATQDRRNAWSTWLGVTVVTTCAGRERPPRRRARPAVWNSCAGAQPAAGPRPGR